MASGHFHFTKAEAESKVGQRVRIKDASQFPDLPLGLAGTVTYAREISEGRWGVNIEWEPFSMKRAHDTGSQLVEGRKDGFTKQEYKRHLKEVSARRSRQRSQSGATA